MKKLFFVIPFILFFGCKDANDVDLSNKAMLKSISHSQSNMYKNLDYDIVYDAKGNVHSINDTVYSYGNNGKLSSSHFSYKEERYGYKYEKEIIKSYKWDNYSRIEEIKVDKSLERSTSPEGGILENNPSPYVEAVFYYTSNNLLPDSIGHEEFNEEIVTSKIFVINGDNILKEEIVSDYYNYSNSNIIAKRYTTQKKEFKYGNTKNYLYPLFLKMGVLPRGLGYIVSKDAPSYYESSQYFYERDVSGGGVIKEVNREQAEISYNIGSYGYPSRVNNNIKVNQMGLTGSYSYFLNLYY